MRSRVRSLLLLLLLGAILLETLALVRPLLFRAVHRAYPQVGLGEDGRVLYYDAHIERGPDGETRAVYSLDESRNDAETLRLGSAEAMARLSFHGPGLGGAGSFDFDRPLSFMAELRRAPGDRFVPYPPLDSSVKGTLNAVERRRRLLPDEERLASGERKPPPIEWRVEENRLVCRETASGRAVAGLGPDGYARGERADEGERFGQIALGPFFATTRAFTRADQVPLFLFDRDARKIHVISVKEEASVPSDSVEPVALAIETRPLHPFQPGKGETATWPYASVVDRHVLVFFEDGSVIADIEMEPNERAATILNALAVRSEADGGYYISFSERRRRQSNAAVGMQTALYPQPPDGERRRLRLFRPGQPAIVHDVVLAPTRAGEVFLANLTASLALLRPPPLVVASALSPLPSVRRWWWREPWLAGGSYPGWLVLSLALAAFLAWRARRAARERCATVRAVRFWTAAVFLLGPLGFLWMRLVLPRVPVESVGGARRAVNLDASPATSEPWPDPEPQGIEVFS